jgi:2-isopropylmalate synthase
MSRERLYLFDTTLRDGAQTNGVDFTLHDKQIIAQMLDELGIDYVEGGYPGANPTDTEFFADKPKLDSAIHRVRHDAPSGPLGLERSGLAALLEAKADAICFVAKSSAYQVRVALETTNEENLASIRDSVARARRGPRGDGRLRALLRRLQGERRFRAGLRQGGLRSGARWVVLCDTNGGTMPHEVETIVGRRVKQIPGSHVGIHAHNDTEQAVANSLAAVRAGRCGKIQGTLNGSASAAATPISAR